MQMKPITNFDQFFIKINIFNYHDIYGNKLKKII